MSKESIPGNPYSAELICHEYDDPGAGTAFAIVTIKPPVDFSQCEGLVDGHSYAGVKFAKFATTLSTSVYEVEADLFNKDKDAEEYEGHERIRKSVAEIIKVLNKIENGTYPKDKFSKKRNGKK